MSSKLPPPRFPAIFGNSETEAAAAVYLAVIEGLKAENAGLREELNKAAEDEASYSRRCSKVEDENVKLRAVLQQLADSDNANSDLDAKCAARRLLEAKP